MPHGGSNAAHVVPPQLVGGLSALFKDRPEKFSTWDGCTLVVAINPANSRREFYFFRKEAMDYELVGVRGICVPLAFSVAYAMTSPFSRP